MAQIIWDKEDKKDSPKIIWDEAPRGIVWDKDETPGVLDYLNPATAFDYAAGGLAGLGSMVGIPGAEQDAAQILARAEQRAKESAQSTVGQTLGGIGTGVLDIVGGGFTAFPAQLGATARGLYEGQAIPQALQYGQQVGSMYMPSKMLGIDQYQQTPAYAGTMAPLEPIMQAPHALGQIAGKTAEAFGATPGTAYSIEAGTEIAGLTGMGALAARGAYRSAKGLPVDQTKETTKTTPVEGNTILPEGFGASKAKQAHEFVTRDVESLRTELSELESKKKEIDLVGKPEEKVIVDEAVRVKKQELETAENNKARLEDQLGIKPTAPRAVVESAKRDDSFSGLTDDMMDDRALVLEQKISTYAKQLNALEKQGVTNPELYQEIRKKYETALEEEAVLQREIAQRGKDRLEEKLSIPGLWVPLGKTKNVKIETSLNYSFDSRTAGTVGRTKLSHVIESFVEKLGLGDHKLVIGQDLFRTKEAYGSTRIIGDTTYISLNRKTIDQSFESLYSKNEGIALLYDALSRADQFTFRQSVVMAHELGHAFWYRAAHSYFKDTAEFSKLSKWYVNWVRKQQREGKTEYLETAKVLPEHFLWDETFTKGPFSFTEYLAQQTARELVIQGNLYKKKIQTSDFGFVTEERFFSRSPIGQWIKGFREFLYDIFSNYRGTLTRPGTTVDSAINKLMGNIIRENEVTSKLGETVFTHYERTANVFGAGRSLQDTQTSLRNLSHWEIFGDRVKEHDDLPITNVPISGAEAIGKMKQDIGPVAGKVLFNAFGKMQLGSQWGIFAENPVLRYTYATIRNAQAAATQIANRVWYGSVQPKQQKWVGPFVKLGRIANEDSPAVMLKRATNEDKYAVLKVFEQGFVSKMEYADSLRQYGTGLTTSQKQLFQTLANMFKQQHMEIQQAQKKLGKTHLLPYRTGWYPAVRLGDWFVELKMAGVGVHREHFRSKEQANIFYKKFQAIADKQNLEATIPLEKTKGNAWDSAEFLVELIQKELEAKGMGKARAEVEALVERLTSFGGTLGKHHRQRFNISGYQGSELFKSANELGEAFGNAIHSSLDEYTNTLSKMIINQRMTEINNAAPEIKERFQNTFDAAKLLEDTALNKLQVLTEGLDKSIRKYFDNMAASAGRAMGKKDYFPAHSAFDRANGLLTNLFYIFTLTLRPGFWFANMMTTPLTAPRVLLREGGILRSMASFSSGTLRLMYPDQEFKRSIYWLSQNTNVLHPQFINDLNRLPLLNKTHGEYVEKTVNFFTGQTFSSISDSFSRYWAYSVFFEQFRAKGLQGVELWRKAAEATDSAMTQYGQKEKAPMFQKTGIAGEMVSPLQTYSQARLGDLLADFKYMAEKKTLKSSAPLIATFLSTSMLAGIMGVSLLAEYEFIRLALEKMGLLDENEFSLRHLVMSGDNRILSHGIFSETGYDLASSMRSNPIVRGIVDGESKFIDMFPAISWATDTATHAGTIIKSKFKDVPKAEVQTAKLALTPGWYKGVVDDLMFNAQTREFVPSYGKGYATVRQTPEERTATYLGVRTTDTATKKTRQKIVKEQSEMRSTKLNRELQLLMDAYEANDTQKAQEHIGNLITEHYVDPGSLPGMIKEQILKRNIPEYEREMYGTGTSATLPRYWKYQQYEEMENP